MENLYEAITQYVITNFGEDQRFRGYDAPNQGDGNGAQMEWFRSEPAPTTQQLEEARTAWLALQYLRDRKMTYDLVGPSIGDQLDMLWHAIDGDGALKTSFADFHTAIKAIKDAHPKP